jgi:osmotically-inducible protein OsmY
VDDRVVTLNGELGSEAERELAITIAENTTDVKSVKNNITIDAE